MSLAVPAPAKAGVENQVGVVRQRFFTPRLRVKSLEELNAWLLDRCVAYARAHTHPEFKERTVWEVFEEERPKLIAYAGHWRRERDCGPTFSGRWRHFRGNANPSN